MYQHVWIVRIFTHIYYGCMYTYLLMPSWYKRPALLDQTRRQPGWLESRGGMAAHTPSKSDQSEQPWSQTCRTPKSRSQGWWYRGFEELHQPGWTTHQHTTKMHALCDSKVAWNKNLYMYSYPKIVDLAKDLRSSFLWGFNTWLGVWGAGVGVCACALVWAACHITHVLFIGTQNHLTWYIPHLVSRYAHVHNLWSEATGYRVCTYYYTSHKQTYYYYSLLTETFSPSVSKT